MMAALLMFVSTLAQNASNTFVSRARNSRSLRLNAIASVLSNGVFLLVLSQVVKRLDDPLIITAYISGAVAGSVGMHWLSMRHIEHRFENKGTP